jgi:hypothetical protein
MRPRQVLALTLAVLLAGLLPGTSWAATIYVDVNNNTGTENGSQQFPFTTIQAGINAAAAFDQVQVAAGVYNETIAVRDGVSVFGAGPGQSIIDGASRQNSVVTFNHVRFNPRFDGFTIRNGNGDFIGTLGGKPIHVGGGIQIVNSGPFITNNVIEDCVLDKGIGRGAGIYINNSGYIPSIIGNEIVNNVARSTVAPGESRGGGIFITSKVTSTLVTENIIDLNVSDVGGGLYNKNLGSSTLTVERNDFRLNEATDGAAIFTTSFSNSSTTVVNNLFVGNGSTAGEKDCNDGNGSSAPGSGEICNDGIDNDCDPSTPDIFDGDGDGAMCDVDCNDADPTISPLAGEHCGDEIDNDCDGNVDVSNPDNFVLVAAGSAMTYLANETDPAITDTWVDVAFDDSSWTSGNYGVGYEDAPPGAENLFVTAVNSGTYSVYTRTLFDVTDTNFVNTLFLAADFDDGYVAWINGVEVFRSPEMPGGSVDWNTAATAGESSNAVLPDYGTLVDISTAGIPELLNGTNVLAIGVWNDTNASDDLVLVPWLSMSYGTDDTDCLCADVDMDFYRCDDCDDTVPTTNPGAPEICADGVDNDCDPATFDIVDADFDGYNCAIDCNDADASVSPADPEVYCDGIDNDCNPGTVDVVDLDQDFADCTVDCNDSSASVFPGQLEFCFDGLDNNCDGFIDTQDLECNCPNPVDLDADGYRCTDCNDGNASINPGEVEICNDGIDNDCRAATPDVFDGDGDGQDCDTDCQDFNAAVNASAIEICNDTIDNDCDNLTDGADPDCAGGDADSDGYDVGVDCNDGDPAINPGAAEICDDGIDNDCDPGTLDVDDLDADSYDCTVDCDDSNASINPGVPEQCSDLIDNDCDGAIDLVNPDLVLVQAGSSMKYLANSSDPGIGIAWRLEVFNDDSWNSGIFGVGYQFGTPSAGNSVEDLAVTIVPDGTASVYTRTEFEITDTGSVNGIFLGADYDDGFIVYINEAEVYRSPEMPAGPPTWDADPALHESSNGVVPDYGTLIDITLLASPVLKNGTNLLAIGLYNEIPAGGGSSSDLILVPRLSLNFGDDDPDCLCVDLDGDGFSCSDCDDMNPLRSPGLPEIGCDGLDNDCDGGTPDVIDGDMDGFQCDVDCADNNPLVFPGATEIPCDFINNDCNGNTPDIFDADLDSYDCQSDCDETDANVNPGMTEIGCDGIDNDCNPFTADVDDADFDTYRCDQDCDDVDPAVNPGAIEKCDDGIDNDCDGLTDSVAADVVLLESGAVMRYLSNYADPVLAETWAATAFDDSAWSPGFYGLGYEDTLPGAADLIQTTVASGAYSLYTRTTFEIPDAAQVNALSLGADFDDGYAAWINGVEVYRSAEMPAAGSFDWNTAATNGESSNGTTPDYGTLVDISTAGLPALVTGTNVLAIGAWNDVNTSDDLVLVPKLEMNISGDTACGCGDGDADGYECEDCDDIDPAVNPAATEVCNDAIDNDCDPGTLDVGDADGDGFDCLADCDDTNPFIRPNAAEMCNDGIDNDCNPATFDIVDADMDSYGCDVDCADNDPTINPGVVEQCNDTIDNDCNPSTVDIGDLDFDGTICTFDCDDQDGTVGPGEVEVCNDGIDNDCNPATPDIFDGDGDGALCNVDCDDADPTRGQTVAEKCDDGVDNDCDGAIDSMPGDVIILEFGSSMRYLANHADPVLAETWAATAFDDSAWSLGLYGVGYEDTPPGATSLLQSSVASGAYSVYTRASFVVEDVTLVNSLSIGADYDDGYTAWINGVEVRRSAQMPGGALDWNTASSSHESSNDPTPDYGNLADISTAGIPALVNGTNILAIGVWNDANTSDDLVLVPRLQMNVSGDAACQCADGDSDGYACEDCNDGDPAINPAAVEACNDAIDNDCDPATPDVGDYDNDGFLCTAECDDTDPLAFPSGVEICNDGIDNDCDPATLDIDDLDSDTYDCTVDCDDSNALINPGVAEVGCDSVDNDCDPMTSDLADIDGDGFSCVDGSVRGGAVTALAKSSSATLSIINNTFYNNAVPAGIGGAVYVDDLSARSLAGHWCTRSSSVRSAATRSSSTCRWISTMPAVAGCPVRPTCSWTR